MARRGKRGADIDMQADRLVNIADDSGNYDRMDRINSIRARYKSNIAHSLGTNTSSEKAGLQGLTALPTWAQKLKAQ